MYRKNFIKNNRLAIYSLRLDRIDSGRVALFNVGGEKL